MTKIHEVIIEYSGTGWYGEIYGFADRWSWAVALDFGDRLKCQCCGGFASAAAAERSLKAFLALRPKNDIDRWISFVDRLLVT